MGDEIFKTPGRTLKPSLSIKAQRISLRTRAASLSICLYSLIGLLMLETRSGAESLQVTLSLYATLICLDEDQKHRDAGIIVCPTLSCSV